MTNPPQRERRRLLAGVAAFGAVSLTGCATQTAELLDTRAVAAGLPRRVELAQVPFFPQDQRFLCGPESLAAVLQAAGVAATPPQLVPQVYLPGREGSLQAEMLAATRRQGGVAVMLPPQLEALCRELAAGTPVVILQNLGLAVSPVWHYAVAVGYDLDERTVLLRSGRERRMVMSLRTFEHTWARSAYWAFVAVAPGLVPVTAGEAEMTRALVAFERVAAPELASRAYTAAVQRWPANVTLLMGQGNTLYAAGRKREAAEVFEATARHHEHGAAWVNLGLVQLELGHLSQAEAAARRAVELGGNWSAQANKLLRKVEAAQQQTKP
ncbi:PA2778 family cysteine peptidase [Schlegelella sp. S2-27]|uniref:PA2778 family cysteine peptidase n=1 Tax=Caldimonas mangrovi TaxID=2944811 RepID=A0ABT0YNF1_9BURK|nr:PA2778 family cysteine peptidase [Caldimonas mangrovi]MCM5680247.1 PA2778 family cysteine peptidase [Caldimonas mangrovi]